MKRFVMYIGVGILLFSCSANKYLSENQKYFEGFEIRFEEGAERVPAEVENGLLSGLDPSATRRFLVSRPGTWIYHQIDTVKKDKGIKHFIKYRLGNKPNYLGSVDLERNLNIVESRMKAGGFFRAQVQYELDSAEHRATVVYVIDPGLPYRFDSLQICEKPEPYCGIIKEMHSDFGVIEKGNLFAKKDLVNERNAISNAFRNDGYFYFNPSLLYYKADSSVKERQVAIRLNLRDSIPPVALQKFNIDSVKINLAANTEDATILGDSLKIRVDKKQLFMKPKKLAPFIMIKPGNLYSKREEELTLKHLNKLDIFEFVNLEYEVDTTDGRSLLGVNILATPRQKHSLQAQAVVTTTSTNFTGPGLQLRYSNRNLFRGAEKLNISAIGRYERQLSGSRKGLTSYELDLEAKLLIPRVSGPFELGKLTGNLPSTKYSVSYRYFKQPEYYTQSNFGASFGYEWVQNNRIFHDLQLINIDYVRLLESSTRLEQLFEDGILSRESFNDQLIFGPYYSVTFAPKEKENRIASYYLGGSIGFAGNILYGFSEIAGGEQNSNGQYRVFGVPFAQYGRIQLDSRIYVDIGKYSQLILRQNAGVGIPFLNSNNLPFAKQFFVGGTTSLRGFQPRAVGPGTYENQGNEFDSFFDQTGDIMLEWNAETRFDLGGYLNGAVFLDVGNVWLIEESDARPGGEFGFDSFFNQLAVSGGAGLRIDIEFVVIRFDLGVPLRAPSRPKNDRWLFDQMDSDGWWGDNLILNVAIGYPF